MLRRNLLLAHLIDKSYLVASIFAVGACGTVDQPRYVPYGTPAEQATATDQTGDATGTGTPEQTAGTPGTPAENCAATALQSFNVYVQNEITAKCSNAACHGTGGGGAAKFALSARDASVNRTTVKNYLTGDANKLTVKFQSGTHSGGDLSQGLTQAEINSWLSAESKCSS